VLYRPPEPNASPQPTNRNCIGPNPKNPVRALNLYRPRGAPNIRDNSQIGMTITAPSRK